MSELRSELPPLPDRMKSLPVDHRGYPVPWFVAWLNEARDKELPRGEGEPDFRVTSHGALVQAHNDRLCWICGKRLGRYRAFTIGPMCAVNRINSEPPSHVACSDFSARACPFLSRPHMRRRENDRIEGGVTAGIAIDRNPGACAVWIIEGVYRWKRDGSGGVLFDLPEPSEIRWYAHGRTATCEEIEASIESGLPELYAVCQSDGERAEVDACYDRLRPFLPDAANSEIPAHQ